MNPRTSRIAMALALLVVTLGLAACSVSIGGSSDEIDHKKAEKLIKDNVTPTPTSVSCPSGIKIKQGGTFDCTFTLPNGKTGTVTIHMTNSNGHIEFGPKDIHGG